MKDVSGKTLRIGDKVAFNPAKYKGLKVGWIEKFNPKMVRVGFGRGDRDFINVWPDNTSLIT